jgi:hypothetical protein
LASLRAVATSSFSDGAGDRLPPCHRAPLRDYPSCSARKNIR